MDWLVAIFGVWTDAGYVKPGVAFQIETTVAAELRYHGDARAAEPDEIPTGEEEGSTPAASDLSALPPYHELRIAAINAAIATLTDADFTPTGNARLAALRPKLAFDPTGGEVFRGDKRKVA